MTSNWRMFIPSSVMHSFWTFLDILIMGLPSNLVEILIIGVHRPHGLLVTLHWISVISWPLKDHTLSVHFRTNFVEIFIRDSTDLIYFWSHFIEFPSYHGHWLAIHFPWILDKLVGIIIRGSSDLIKIRSYFVEFSYSYESLSTCRTFPEKNCSWDWPKILWKYLLQKSIYLVNIWLCFTAFSLLPELWLT